MTERDQRIAEIREITAPQSSEEPQYDLRELKYEYARRRQGYRIVKGTSETERIQRRAKRTENDETMREYVFRRLESIERETQKIADRMGI
jgi:hypothetical protein